MLGILGKLFFASLLTFFLIWLRLSLSVLLSEESAGGVSHCDDPIFSLVATVYPQQALDLTPLGEVNYCQRFANFP